MRWLALAVLLAATPAAADDTDAPVRARARLDGDTARLDLRYELRVTAGAWMSPAAELVLPRGGVVTSARATIGGRAHALALTPAAAASATFAALIERGPRAAGFDEVTVEDVAPAAAPGRAPSSGVLIAAGAGRAQVSLASARTGTLVVDLEVAAPTCFHRDARYLAVPEGWSIRGAALVAPAPDEAAALEAACGDAGEDTPRWVRFASPVRAGARADGRTDARIAAMADGVDLGAQRVARVELDLATTLADVPRDLATVLVVDGSRSMTERDRDAQRELVRAYLDKAPGTRVQVVAFARRATALLPAWQRGAAASRAVDDALAKLVPANGSNLDAGLAEASAWLAKVRGTKRIVLVTDELMAMRLHTTPPAQLARLVPTGTLIHVAVPSPNEVQPVRRDALALAGLAAATEGMAVAFGAPDGERLDATVLVRPLSLDHLALASAGWQELARGDGEVRCEDELSLAAGGACTWWGQAPRATASPLTLTGQLWGKRVTFTLAPSADRAVDVARALSMHAGAPPELRPQIDERARAVNSVWSLLATWGRPGDAEWIGGGTGWGAICGCDAPGTIGHGGVRVATVERKPAPQVPLAEQLAASLAACKLGRERVDVEVELTRDEIADVRVTARAPALATCVAEVVWASAPRIAQPLPHQVMRFTAGG